MSSPETTHPALPSGPAADASDDVNDLPAEQREALEALEAVLPAPAQAARNRAADVELAARCRAGEPAAWEYLVRQYSRRVYQLAYKFVGRHEQAEDLTQEVFLKIYRSLDQYNPEVGDFPNWLLRLARNLIIDDYRRRQRQPVEGGEDLEAHVHRLQSRTDHPQQRIERQEQSLQIMQAIEKLSPDLRQCVIMRDIEEMTYQEIVEKLQIPEGTVKSRINRGRIELARILRRMKVIGT
ncbi:MULTISPECIES: RNA polymerase sigma factor [Chloracidobacterium]|jgi:RNA polymerase sigma-70 factor (ECF subfamily)|uniref:RNA polymerase sigma factor, sigma-70 family n=1 Tax=Chloracidobacterium thermophilum (strain B) TaxID=981222 RepID=G2LEG1_CHLTF|nr:MULTISPECIES: sigma-70 family RNA polymerase sigma factor [Chloracidobacterium]AEP11624.1 RNA polymerase sigma factor, sigma-70 family [Chloracidobacterium thermophilum B]QUV79510.1 sigma-70 family RNA polymerase sigma factor [Chloracidobacterium thermophilum]QUV82548.1 sigma-70 family RNA polymerase sigma factor [Chloracidobacterium sp. D]